MSNKTPRNKELLELLLKAVNHVNIIPTLADQLGRSDYDFAMEAKAFIQEMSDRGLNPKTTPWEDIVHRYIEE